MSTLSALGTGLLLGAALGVIIPEYVCEFALPTAAPRPASALSYTIS